MADIKSRKIFRLTVAQIMDFSIVQHPLFIKNLFFHTSLSFAKEQLAYHILSYSYLLDVSSCHRLRNSCQNHPLCCGCTHSLFCADSQWKIDQNMHLIDSTKLSSLRLTNFLCMCASSAHCQFLWISCPVLNEFSVKKFHYSFRFFFKTPLVIFKSIFRNLL